MKASHKISPVFDDPNLVGSAGLVPVLRLAESAGLHDLLEAHLTVDSPAAAVKATGVVAGMAAGADSIDDLDVLRHGAMPKLFTGVRAPSTLGTFLRAFTHGHVKQLDAVASRFLAGLAERVPGLLTGAQDPDGIAFLDLDDTVGEVHGKKKQAAGYGYSSVFGLNAMIATCSTPLACPVIVASSLRKGQTQSGSRSAHMLKRAAATIRRAGVRAQVMGRADSAFYRRDLVTAMIQAGMWFSITARLNPKVTAAIAAISDKAWTPIQYPQAIWDATEQAWVSDAELAEIDFVAFTSKNKDQHVPCRLIVRRVKRLQPAPATAPSKASCSPPTGTTPSSPTAVSAWSRPTRHTVATRSSSRPSPTSKPTPWRTSHRGSTPRTPPGSRSRSSRSTCSAPPRSWPAHATPGPAGPPCALASSASPPGSHPPDDDSSCTCPPAGPGPKPGTNSTPQPTAPRPRR